jgi:glycosyltransferase involved in cell wall biosynthesis
MNRAIWITWENQRRNRELSRRLGIRLYQFEEIDQIKNPFIKYPKGLWKTAKAVIESRPRLMVCQNPSIVLSLCAVLFGKLNGTRIVVDAHNVGLFPLEGRSRLLMILSRFIQRHADLTIVTNPGMAAEVMRNGGAAYILPDPIPDLVANGRMELPQEFNIIFICSYAHDEPYAHVIEAAKQVGAGIHIYVTGNYRKKGLQAHLMPPNVTLLGYVPERDYINILHAVDATIDLTDRPDCLVCGAYESVAAEKPMILSASAALKNYFSKGAVYTDNSVPSLVEAIGRLRSDHARLCEEIRAFKTAARSRWAHSRQTLDDMLRQMPEA